MRSISSGGQPWRVDTVTLPETRGLMLSIKAASPGKNSFKTRMHSRKMGVSEASFMLLRKVSTFSPRIPSRS